MANCGKLLEKARNSPNNLRYEELLRLAECYGWVFERQDGTSHAIYVNESLSGQPGFMMNFQNRRGQAKPSQIRQLLDAIEELEE